MGGTDCSLPMVWARRKKLRVSAFVTYTDSETWAGNIHPAQALRQYRDEFVGDAKAVVVGMTSNGFTPGGPERPCVMLDQLSPSEHRLDEPFPATRNPGAGQDLTGLAAAVQLRLRVAVLADGHQVASIAAMQRSLKPQSTGQHRGDPPFYAGVAQQRQAFARGGSFVNRRAESPHESATPATRTI
jgi:hypothetical protein